MQIANPDLIVQKKTLKKRMNRHPKTSLKEIVDTIFGHVSRMAGQGGSTMRVAGKDGCR